MKRYIVRWHESVAREAVVEAENEDEAWEIVENGEVEVEDTSILDGDYILNSVEEEK